ncbi:MAG: flagellar brake protein [Gallionella sp.]|nr:flagellar brake protein [Gallionella sp.]
MLENIPLTIERLSGEQERECCITSARQIQSLLRNISENGVLAALYYDGAKDFFMTSLLEVGDKGLWAEQGADMPKNRCIAESKRITLVSSLDQVKIQFAVGGARAVTYQGYPAFYLPLPTSLCRVQRREYYRLLLPLSERLRCVIPINQPQAGGQIEVAVMDISGGGIRLSDGEVRLFSKGNDIEFVPGQTYTGCQINLPEVGKINVTITVKSLVSISPKPGQMIKRVGCEFKNLDNASSILLQRYVTKMQRLKACT